MVGHFVICNGSRTVTTRSAGHWRKIQKIRVPHAQSHQSSRHAVVWFWDVTVFELLLMYCNNENPTKFLQEDNRHCVGLLGIVGFEFCL